jgi:hypothetical protein
LTDYKHLSQTQIYQIVSLIERQKFKISRELRPNAVSRVSRQKQTSKLAIQGVRKLQCVKVSSLAKGKSKCVVAIAIEHRAGRIPKNIVP